MVLHFTFRSVVCFELVFVKGVRTLFTFFGGGEYITWWQDFSVPVGLPLLPCQGLVKHICVDQLQGVLLYVRVYLSVLSPELHGLGSCKNL